MTENIDRLFSFYETLTNDYISSRFQDILITDDLNPILLQQLIHPSQTFTCSNDIEYLNDIPTIYHVATFWAETEQEMRIAYNPIESNLIAYNTHDKLLLISLVDITDLEFFIADNFDNNRIVNVIFHDLLDKSYLVNTETHTIQKLQNP